ncbi:hypothetical protein FK545_01790 [Planococcus glaciei]|nr:hypothetical protein [Planococcus glaciei]QDY44699.1 hypothetical protein FK545_01790 [Planococcus glaciei]
MKRFLVPSLFVLLLSACGSEPVMPEVGTPEPETEIPEKVNQAAGSSTEAMDSEEKQKDLYAYFMEDGTIAKYKGEGNEYAALTLRTTYLPEGHIAVYEDNGGTVTLRVYRFKDAQVELVKEEPEFYEEYTPTAEELQALKPISLYYQLPIAVGVQSKVWLSSKPMRKWKRHTATLTEQFCWNRRAKTVRCSAHTSLKNLVK